MQFKKEFMRSAILGNARAEFLEKGFRDATIRSIAKRADTAPSNIYNYYKNKDEIFCAVLENFMNRFRIAQKNFEEHIYCDNHNADAKHQHQMIIDMLQAIKDNQTDLILLIDKSKGSSHEFFIRDVNDWYMEILKKDLDNTVERMSLPKISFQNDTMHLLSGMVISLIVTTIYENVEAETLLDVASEISQFFASGWLGLIEWKTNQSG